MLGTVAVNAILLLERMRMDLLLENTMIGLKMESLNTTGNTSILETTVRKSKGKASKSSLSSQQLHRSGANRFSQIRDHKASSGSL